MILQKTEKYVNMIPGKPSLQLVQKTELLVLSLFYGEFCRHRFWRDVSDDFCIFLFSLLQCVAYEGNHLQFLTPNAWLSLYT